MPPTAARDVARRVVTKIRERRAFAHETLDHALRSAELKPVEQAFVTRLVYGTVASRGTLEEAIARHLHPSVRLEPRVADCLVLSAYELLFMRTPARAAVNEGVELIKAFSPRASSLGNAVLRKLADESGSFPWGDPGTDDAALARVTAHPEWMVRLLVGELGRERAAEVLAADNEPAPLYLAHLPFRVSFEHLMESLERDGARPVEAGLAGAVRCDAPSEAVRSTALKEGWAIVADAAAQFAAACVPLHDGAQLLEVGAGRGTKTLLILARAQREGAAVTLTALDTHPFKLRALERAIESAGAPPVQTMAADASDVADVRRIIKPVDSVLIDAPCSGLGTLRRHPDRRWRAEPAEIDTLRLVGSQLLAATSSVVRPGGFMVYSTCTIVRAENEFVVEGFLASEEGGMFSRHPLEPACAPRAWSSFFSPEGAFRSLPSPGGPDGHFVARLVRDAA